MITPEEMSKFEILFDKLKLLVLSDVSDKFYHINRLAVQMIFLKNEGRKHDTANELGVHVKTLKSYLADLDADIDMLDVHLNRLATEGWFKELPKEEQLAHMDLVTQAYVKEEVTTSVQ
jgi:hypothetical protein